VTWLALLKAILLAAGALAGWLQQRRLLEAGRAESLAVHLKHALDDIALAEKTRSGVRRDLARDPSRLRGDDGFQRKD
jgi:hypothetical protein